MNILKYNFKNVEYGSSWMDERPNTKRFMDMWSMVEKEHTEMGFVWFLVFVGTQEKKNPF